MEEAGPSIADLELELREIRALEAENFMMEAAYARVLEAAAANPETEKAEKTPGQKRRGKDKDAAKAVPHLLTIDQKSKLIQEVLEDQKRHLHGVQDEANSMVFDLQVELDSKDESMSIINLEMIALKQTFALFENPDGTRQGAPAHKMISYLEDKLRRKDGELDKLRTKHMGLKSAVAKGSVAAAELKQKEEGGDSLKPIDFAQLQIDNNKLLDTIEARNSQVLALKATAGAAQRELNNLKQDLLATQRSTQWLLKTKTDKTTLLTEHMHKDSIAVKAIVEKERKLNAKLRDGLETSNNVPSVVAYVMQSEQITTLKKKIKLFQTKIEIGEGQLRQTKRKLQKTLASHYSMPPPEYAYPGLYSFESSHFTTR